MLRKKLTIAILKSLQAAMHMTVDARFGSKSAVHNFITRAAASGQKQTSSFAYATLSQVSVRTTGSPSIVVVSN